MDTKLASNICHVIENINVSNGKELRVIDVITSCKVQWLLRKNLLFNDQLTSKV